MGVREFVYFIERPRFQSKQKSKQTFLNFFVRSCYAKNFGPSEQKYSTHSDTKVIKPYIGDEPSCPRCGGAVFHAEVILAKGKGFHKTCATCLTCNKNLDSLSLNTGPDGDIYCKGCHENHFGSHKGHPYSAYRFCF